MSVPSFFKRDLPPIENLTAGKYTDEQCIAALRRLERAERLAKLFSFGRTIDYHKVQIQAEVTDLQIGMVISPDGEIKLTFELRDWEALMRI